MKRAWDNLGSETQFMIIMFVLGMLWLLATSDLVKTPQPPSIPVPCIIVTPTSAQ